MKKYLVEIASGLLVVTAVAALIYQKVNDTCPQWFHFEEIWSYDVMAFCGVVAAIALIIGKYTGKNLS